MQLRKKQQEAGVKDCSKVHKRMTRRKRGKKKVKIAATAGKFWTGAKIQCFSVTSRCAALQLVFGEFIASFKNEKEVKCNVFGSLRRIMLKVKK